MAESEELKAPAAARQFPQFPLSPERGEAAAPPDYLMAALARLGGAVAAAGFEVSEVTLTFDDDAGEVRLSVRLRIAAELLDLIPALDQEAAGAARHDPITEHERS